MCRPPGRLLDQHNPIAGREQRRRNAAASRIVASQKASRVEPILARSGAADPRRDAISNTQERDGARSVASRVQGEPSNALALQNRLDSEGMGLVWGKRRCDLSTRGLIGRHSLAEAPVCRSSGWIGEVGDAPERPLNRRKARECPAGASRRAHHSRSEMGVRCASVHPLVDLHDAEGLDDIDLIVTTLRRCVNAARDGGCAFRKAGIFPTKPRPSPCHASLPNGRARKVGLRRSRTTTSGCFRSS
jgi:hypothetical protein